MAGLIAMAEEGRTNFAPIILRELPLEDNLEVPPQERDVAEKTMQRHLDVALFACGQQC